jgi:site-specific DNA recombinase
MKIKNGTQNESLLNKFARGTIKVVNSDEVLNCVIYTRVSSKEQMDNNGSLDSQKKYCTEYTLKNRLEVKGFFGGTYESAKSDERKEFNRMLKFVKGSKAKISFIVVYTLDRFSRTGDSAIYIASELKKTGVNIIAVMQPVDHSSHTGALQQNIQFIFSKYDNDLRRQKTMDGMREKLLRGEWFGKAPIGYQYVKGAEKQTIILNEQAKYVKQAFEWRADGMTYEQINDRLSNYDLRIPIQTLSKLFQNPFYCGLNSNKLLNGVLAKGNQPVLIGEDLFLRANQLKKTSGFKSNVVNDNLPLKGFIKDSEKGVPFTGYIVKKKGLYYYKANKVGIKINRSANMMHNKFKSFLNEFTIDAKYIEPLKLQLQYTWDSLTERNTSDKKSLSLKLNEVEESFYNLRKRHAIGAISLEVYEEFSTEMKASKQKLVDELELLNQKLSNSKDLINYTCKLASNLAAMWDLGDYYQKRMFQNMLFPCGIVYNAKNEHYRTAKINHVFGYIAQLSKRMAVNEKENFHVCDENSLLVAGNGIEPLTFGL